MRPDGPVLLPEVMWRTAVRPGGPHGLFGVIVVLTGCSPGDVGLFAPGTAEGDVQHAPTQIVVRTEPADSTVAAALGWNGGVPGAWVYRNRLGTFDWNVDTTDMDGVVEFDATGALGRIFAQRIASGMEAQAAGVEALVFGDGRTGARELFVSHQMESSLLISETGNGTPLAFEVGGSYREHLYFELYNAADTVMFLDGMLYGHGDRAYHPTFGFPRCEHNVPFRTDSLGVHVRTMIRFPGNGSEYPIGPGETRLIVHAAVDHRPVHPLLPDLRHADFEIGGEGGADNPAVPNMLQLGEVGFSGQALFPSGVWALSLPLDLDDIEVVQFPQSFYQTLYRLPADALVDVIALEYVSERDLDLPPCIPTIHPRFDRYEGGFRPLVLGTSEDVLFSIQRKVFHVDDNGRKVLFNTNTSAVDFFRGRITPGGLPEVGEGWAYPADYIEGR